MSKILKKFTEGNGQNLQLNVLHYIFLLWRHKIFETSFSRVESGPFRGQQPEQREMRVFDNSRGIFPFEIFGLTLFKKRLKDIHVAKKQKQDIIRLQIKHCFLNLFLSLKTDVRIYFQNS